MWILSKVFSNKNESNKTYQYNKIDEIDEAQKVEGFNSFTTKVAGVTYENRQELVRRLWNGQALELKAEPDNIYDPYAVKVITKSGEKIGYIPKDFTKNMHNWFEVSDFPCRAEVIRIIGDENAGQSLGVVIRVHPPTDEEIQISLVRRIPF